MDNMVTFYSNLNVVSSLLIHKESVTVGSVLCQRKMSDLNTAETYLPEECPRLVASWSLSPCSLSPCPLSLELTRSAS